VDRYVALVALAGVLGKMRSEDLNNLIMGAQMIKVGRLNTYTMDAEKDADRTAVAYMVKSNYNPEGLLSFMRKLEEKHVENPTVPLGIFQDHPAPYRRVAAIARAMEEDGLKPDLRKLRDVAYAKAAPVVEGSDLYQVTIGKKVVYEPAALKQGASSKERAESIAKNVNTALDAGVTLRSIHEAQGETCFAVNGTEVCKVESADLGGGKEARSLIERARAALEYAVWAEWLCNDCTVTQESSSED
jgi:predicted Zn-dependent protease